MNYVQSTQSSFSIQLLTSISLHLFSKNNNTYIIKLIIHISICSL